MEYCHCADPENCTQPIPGKLCRPIGGRKQSGVVVNLRDEARRLAEEMDSVLSGHISSTNCEYFENILLSFGRLVREEALVEIDHKEEVAALAKPGWETGFAAALRSMDAGIREKLKTLD